MGSHILHTPMAETDRRPYGERWCFVCRTRRPFDDVVTTPIVIAWCPLDAERRSNGDGEVEFSTGAYYGPSRRIECAHCKTVDGDCFPGTWREWRDAE